MFDSETNTLYGDVIFTRRVLLEKCDEVDARVGISNVYCLSVSIKRANKHIATRAICWPSDRPEKLRDGAERNIELQQQEPQ